MTYIADNFVRADGALGSNWATPVPSGTEGMANALSGGILVNGNGFGPIAAGGGDCCSLWAGAGSFGDNQWASASFKTIAGPTATLTIIAATQSGSNTTFAYTVATGDISAQIAHGNLYVLVSGMQHSQNNGTFNPTTFGVGTFTVANASGITEVGSTGAGFCPSDSGAGVMVRGSGTTAGTLNGYFFHVGSNSNGGLGRKYYYELWKVVNGAGTILGGSYDGALSLVAPVAGDVLSIAIVGSKLTCYYNGKIPTAATGAFQLTDTSIASGGVPGLWSFSMSGANQYDFPSWTTVVNPPGNNGTTLNNFRAGDFAAANIDYFDNFVASSGTPDIHTYNASWVDNSGTFSVAVTGIVQGATYVGSNALASWQGAAFANDQWVQATATNANSVGVALRAADAANTAYFYRPGAANTRVLFKVVAGSFTNLGTSNTSHTNVIGDTYRLVAIGTTISAYLNGTIESFGPITDNAIAAGHPGLQAASPAAAAPLSSWNAGNVGLAGNAGVAAASMALTGTATATVTADSNGKYIFPSLADGSYTITPTLAGYSFSPASIAWTLVGAVIYPTGLNFKATASSAGSGSWMQAFRNFINKRGGGF